MSSIGYRLRKERERLNLNQTEFAEAGGTTRKTQFNYETNVRRPDADYLAAIATAGADVLYVLTGQRAGAVALPLLDTKVLTGVIKLVEQLLAKTGRTLTPAQKAKHVATLYQALASDYEADVNAIAEALVRAA